MTSPLVPLPIPKSSDRTWLPDFCPDGVAVLDLHFPHGWVDPSLVVHKAAKSDTANVPSHLWSSRITQVVGGSVEVLDILRMFALRYTCRRLLRSFCRYMRRNYGRSWITLLVTVRRSCKRTWGGDFSFAVSQEPRASQGCGGWLIGYKPLHGSNIFENGTEGPDFTSGGGPTKVAVVLPGMVFLSMLLNLYLAILHVNELHLLN